ncbi:hypothetical protein BACCAP_01079 [Pseudoflavonifractor capillosus ATCC 29799]|uniref:Uncharacterized protein n=1 Tax=Pseudoflavonifractor capillosus ATCC 29799 TaxID=411467 RepID=A6NSA0_9FIRM|nr:hypothetical protein BACCAP_01079 [Pseudoflavonifractor capillosus ATCC 29799]
MVNLTAFLYIPHSTKEGEIMSLDGLILLWSLQLLAIIYCALHK